ncbi:NADH-quinone oxidoreductase subunit C [Candidatus Comchoanobacter bicostacola]|uniref:NADH-quinone oxidoreductase subunit C n=1 Tax=Candidatus Comchoanobacter bicostacola TaxID=2919598 RepID=A0ABY5DKW4_9GAMM|nr:NADH-quinone oxidoreductase subunit C [Candidatus Comchoanobacter bicostacola]UTC24785.1 NADH-quinone oxidoreductase subunit C [Candidatus Comchoanobacter bicostacola]
MNIADELRELGQGIVSESLGQVSLQISAEEVLSVAKSLKTNPAIKMNMLLDLCGVDYLYYGVESWQTEGACHQSYCRARAEPLSENSVWTGARFQVVCHLLSITHNQRMRLKVDLDDSVSMPSLSGVWPSSVWYEREAFDLFGIQFKQHPDLRRILTDYGFVGFPMRKDFPLVGRVEMRYDSQSAQCVYDPVSIEYQSHVPRMIRNDHRYVDVGEESGERA